MNETTLVSLIGLGFTFGGGIIGWYAKVLIASTKAKSAWNGQERREQILGTIQGQIAIHTLACPNLAAILVRLANIDGKLDDHIKFHMEQRP